MKRIFTLGVFLVLGLCIVQVRGGVTQASETALDEATSIRIEATTSSWPASIRGEVLDQQGAGIPDAAIAFNGVEHRADSKGSFSIEGEGSGALIIKKAGFRKVVIEPQPGNLKISLEPQSINGVYVQSGVFKNHSSPVMINIGELLRTTELNALVVDVKDDDGRVSGGMKPYIDEMHAKGVYMIARIVSFKDNTAPRAHPELAIIDKRTGVPWQDHHKTTYLDPYNSAAHAYIIQIAMQAVVAGFDEIQFDYVRFPTDGDRDNAKWPAEFTPDTRTGAIASFLKEAQKQLGGQGAFIAADVFGDTAYVKTDDGIGQRVEDITPFLDYVCPMIYPSGFGKGTAGYAIPTDHPKEIIEDSMRRYRLRSDPETVIRPWLQAFRDYAYNHREYGADEISAQIDGANAKGGNGYLLWNAANRYTNAGLKKKALKGSKQLP